jgi:hypothetical protein
MSYMIDCATKEEWAARCFGAEERLEASQARITELKNAGQEYIDTLKARIDVLESALKWVSDDAKKCNDAPMYYRVDKALKDKP